MIESPLLFSTPMVQTIMAHRKKQTRRVARIPYLNSLGVWEPMVVGGPHGGVDSSGHTHPQEVAIWHTRTGYCFSCPLGGAGDRIWVKETFYAWGHWTQEFLASSGRTAWHFVDSTREYGRHWRYVADGKPPEPLARRRDASPKPRWWRRPAIFMTRAASRIDLEITAVTAQHLQDITEEEARLEGCEEKRFPGPWWQGYRDSGDGELSYQQAVGEQPPEWMVEPHRMSDLARLDVSARDAFRTLWDELNAARGAGWQANPLVWVITFDLASPHAALGKIAA